MAISAVGTASPQRVTSGFTSVASAWGASQTRTAGNLLVAILGGGCSTLITWSVSENSSTWTQQQSFGNNAAGTSAQGIAVFTKTAAGGDAAPSFNTALTGTGVCSVTLLELSGANTLSPVDTSGKYQSGGSAGAVTFTATTAANVAVAGEYAISVFGIEHGSAAQVWVETGTGWTSLQSDSATSVSHTQTNTQANPASGATLTDSGHFTSTTNAFGVGLVLVFAAAAQQGVASITGAGSLSANAVQGATVPLAGAGFLGGSSLYGSGTYGSGTYDGPPAQVAAIQGTFGTVTGAGGLVAQQIVTGAATLTGAGALTVPAIQKTTLALTGAGALTNAAVQLAPVALTGTGNMSTVAAIQGTSLTLTGAGSLTAATGSTVNGTAALAGAGAVTAAGAPAGAAALAGAGAVTAHAAIQGTAGLAGAGTLVIIPSFQVARSAGSVTGTGTSVSGVSDPRDGEPSVS